MKVQVCTVSISHFQADENVHINYFLLNEQGLWNGCFKSTRNKNADFFSIVNDLVFYGCFRFVLLNCKRNIQFMNMYSQLLSLGD